MKKTLLLATLTAANAFALEKQELMPLIETASTNRESAYVEARNKIVECGKDALPALSEIAMDETLPWQQQLVARICYERIARKKDIETLLATNWREHPNFDPDWGKYLTGPSGFMVGMITGELKEVGLWHYYLELEWKATGEEAKVRAPPGYWLDRCSTAVKDNPEERAWFLRVCSDLMADTPRGLSPLPPRLNWLLNTLLSEKRPDTAPLLFQYLLLRNNKQSKVDNWFWDVAGYADSRSEGALERLAAWCWPSVDLAPQLAEVCARPAPPPVPETFRLGSEVIGKKERAVVVEKRDLMPLVETAATSHSSVYVAVRNRITEYGTGALPILGAIAVDETLPWQQQLVARICYERIERRKDWEKLLLMNWRNKGKLVTEGLKEIGLWYYYLEVEWKMTGEVARIKDTSPQDDAWAQHNHWMGLCSAAVKDNPGERAWFLKVCAEAMAAPPPDRSSPPDLASSFRRIQRLFHMLWDEKEIDSIPLVLQYLLLRNRPKENAGNWFFEMLDYADSRSADAIEKYLAKRRFPIDFASKLAEIRARPAPPEPFRLGMKVIETRGIMPAAEKQRLMPLIETAATATSNAYVEARDKIVEYGKDALPVLGAIAMDKALPWQQQLVARICYERIERKKDIEDLLAKDWYTDPDFDSSKTRIAMWSMINDDFLKIGLWHYYLEVGWKMTGEKGKHRTHFSWIDHCTLAINCSPVERVWHLKMCADVMANTPPDSPPPHLNERLLHGGASYILGFSGAYPIRIVLYQQSPDVVPLVFRYLLWDNAAGGVDDWFLEMLGYADSRSADMIAKYLAQYPISFDLTPQLAAVRARPAPPPAATPFRLGTRVIKP